MGAFLALNAIEQSKPFRRDFRIGQNVFYRGEFRFGKKEGGGLPVQQALVKQFLGSNVWAQDPDRFRIFPASAATRKAWAGSATWEKATGRTPSVISRNFCEIGSA